ncbi:azurin [Stenotrophomonas acidaminiphila]|nr:azurin [Stenotrophomonas acidaminiphila]
MKTSRRLLLALALVGAAGAAQAAGNCTVSLKGNDAMQFDLKEATVSASCATVTIELTHTGKLPATAMGHNVVVSTTADMAGVNRDAIRAGVANNYVQPKDARVIAHTTLIGGGQKTQVRFPGNKLTAGGDYSFYCSFPGLRHILFSMASMEHTPWMAANRPGHALIQVNARSAPHGG